MSSRSRRAQPIVFVFVAALLGGWLVACEGPSVPTQDTAASSGGTSGQAGSGTTGSGGSASTTSGSGGGGSTASGSGGGGSTASGNGGGGNATSGNGGNATSGNGGNATSGNGGNATSGNGGNGGNATSGNGGNAASGNGGSAAGAAAGVSGSGGVEAGAGGSSGAAGGSPAPIADVACGFAGAGSDCIRCGGQTCIDTHADPAHCGACNHACPAGDTCRNGSCGATITTGGGTYVPSVIQGGRVYGWGYNKFLGLGSQPQGVSPLTSPTAVPSLGTELRTAATSNMSCAADVFGVMRCVGLNAQGQLGIGTTGGPDGCDDDVQPKPLCHGTAQVAKLDGVTEIHAGEYWQAGTHVCARRADRSVFCWGDLSRSGGVPVAAPVKVVGLPASAGLAVTHTAHCSRACDGTVTCWGANQDRELGRDTEGNAAAPGAVPDVRLTSLAGAGGHFCGIDEQRRLVCWGNSAYGQSGPGQKVAPQVVEGVSDVVQVAVGNSFTCARTAKSEVFCFGHTIAVGTTAPRPPGCTADVCTIPAKVALDDVVEIGAGAAVMLARRKDGSYWTWGSREAQLGNGIYQQGFTKQPEKVLPFP